MDLPLTPAGVLKVVRDRAECTIEDLLQTFQAPLWPDPDDSVVERRRWSTVGHCLRSLSDAGLVKFYRASGAKRRAIAFRTFLQVRDPSRVNVALAKGEAWQSIQDSLSISLTHLAVRQSGNAMVVSPLFGSVGRIRRLDAAGSSDARPSSRRPARGIVCPRRQAGAGKPTRNQPAADGGVRHNRRQCARHSRALSGLHSMNKSKFVSMIPSILTTANVDNCLAPCPFAHSFHSSSSQDRSECCAAAVCDLT